METNQNKISALLGKPVQYILPMFQRRYSWEEKQWKKLWSDIIDIRKNRQPMDHFLGSIVVLQEDSQPGRPPRFSLIDGQQRLTTFSLILCALRDLVRVEDPASTLAKKIDDRFLVDSNESDEYRFKIVPTQDDRDAFQRIILKGSSTNESQIERAYFFFRGRLVELRDKSEDNHALFDSMFSLFSDSFILVTIQLSKGENAYRIFESLNATGLSLTQGDLVRNYVFMRFSNLPQEEQFELFRTYWHPIEDKLSDKTTVGKSNIGEFTGFLRHYLATFTGELANKSDVYFDVRARLDKEFPTTEELKVELERICRYSKYYDRFLRPEKDKTDAGAKLQSLKRLEHSTAFPFLLQVFEDHYLKRIDDDELLQVLDVLENYMVRRYLCDESTNYMNKMFAVLHRGIEEGNFVEELKRALSTRNYPRDYKVTEVLQKQKLYGRADRVEKLRLVLERIEEEQWDSKDALPNFADSVSVEHILPQTLSEGWKDELGEEYKRIHSDLCDTLGNLTLTGRNSELGNRSFADKKVMLSSSEIKLNRYFSGIQRWDEPAILSRSGVLSERAIKLWPEFDVESTTKELRVLKPLSMKIRTQEIQVKSWRDVSYQVSDFALRESPTKFLEFARRYPQHFIPELLLESSAQRVLSNGWGVYINKSGEDTRKFCLRLLKCVGVDNSEFEVSLG